MKRKRHTPEEVIKKLRRADEELAGGKGIEDVCRSLEISPATYHRWAKDHRHKYNHIRPHSQLGYTTPAKFAASCLAPLRPTASATPNSKTKPNNQPNLS